MPSQYPQTPDGRYFLAKDRLWRRSDPRLSQAERQKHVDDLMKARRAVRDADNAVARREARKAVHAAKVALGERGPVWWANGDRDWTRFHPKNTPYAGWWRSLCK